MPRRRHPDREIEMALQYAEAHGWRVETSSGHAHAWGRMYCPGGNAGCGLSNNRVTTIAGTPRSAGDHARRLRHLVDRCLGACVSLKKEV